MNSHLQPKYKSTIGSTIVLWFFNSNRYVVVDNITGKFIEVFLASNSIEDFKNRLSIESKTNSKELYLDIKNFLTDCNQTNFEEIQTEYTNHDHIAPPSNTFEYSIFDQKIQINYESTFIQSYLHPKLKQLSKTHLTGNTCSFTITTNKNHLLLFKNKEFQYAFLKKDYHKLQGKFNFLLLCELYNKQESDWLGTFHASTLGNEKEAIMLIGDSGNGKSTLSALLMAHGLDLISDDITAMLADNLHVYRNPNAISIKQGAFEVLKPYFQKLDSYDDVFINKTKGYVKYIPPSNTNPKKI
ncbi:hypothetical protein [Mangrovimonas sp. YM274]|uniref:hypothetical protein n=1 Tax=Mangrovimonas sp. YM274 TaxID=3070660 RepID=UPI0027DDAF88|nr:hypothetical protein [Mangrovimonas sp. YM274]WMI68468.1 hypothetical protein RBH95_15115 [Mangrovimonas sp. YM274]